MFLRHEVRSVRDGVRVGQHKDSVGATESFLGPVEAGLPDNIVEIVADRDLLVCREHRQSDADLTLGEVPGGFLCPCHGSTFDMAGRVFKDKPAPDNLEVPPYAYLSDSRLIIGEDKKA